MQVSKKDDPVWPAGEHYTNWKMGRNYLSLAYTTNMNQILSVTV